MIRPRVRRKCDLRDAHLAGWPVYHSAFDARRGDISLQEMRADAPDFFRHRPAGFADGAAGEHDGARREGAEAVRPDCGVAVAHGNLSWVEAELMGGDLRQRRFVAW